MIEFCRYTIEKRKKRSEQKAFHAEKSDKGHIINFFFHKVGGVDRITRRRKIRMRKCNSDKMLSMIQTPAAESLYGIQNIARQTETLAMGMHSIYNYLQRTAVLWQDFVFILFPCK